MPRLLYTLVYYLLMPAIVLRLLWRSRKTPAYRHRLGERFGLFRLAHTHSKGKHKFIWIHAVSVGEAIAAAKLVQTILDSNPGLDILITTMTPTGSARVLDMYQANSRVFHVYAPYDLPGSVARFLNKTTPSLCIIMETELWPNMINACFNRNIPVLLANARLSEKSAKGYRLIAPLTRSMLQQLQCIGAQSKEDGDRFIALGLHQQQLNITGSIKFDIDISDSLRQQAEQLKLQWHSDGPRLVFIAASTHPGENERLLAVFQEVKKHQPNLLLILAPRHPEFFESVLTLSRNLGLQTVQRSHGERVNATTDVVVADTMGEMMLLYGASDIVFVGGTLIRHGGHNFLEPAAWQLPLISGDSLYNFVAISQLLIAADALQIVENDIELVASLKELCTNEERRLQQGRQAAQVVESNRGALQKLLQQVEKFL